MMPTRKTSIFLPLHLAILVALAPARARAAEAIVKHPDRLAYPPFTYTPPSAKDFRAVLKSGPVVYVAEDHELPLVNVQVTLRGGTYLNPRGKEGLAELAGYLLTRGGTRSRKAEDLEERLAFLAAQLNSSYGEDRGTVTLNLLSKDLDEGLQIVREVLTEPRFQDDRLKLRKDQVLAEMKQRNDDSAGIEARERGFLAYGEDFYLNRLQTKASIDSITREDLVAFHQRWVVPKNAIVALAGDVKKDDVLRTLDKLFASWPFEGEAAPPVPKPAHELVPGSYLVDKDVNQGRVSILLPGLLRTDPDYFACAIMNDILGGGGFVSRIMNRVRTSEGLAYSAGSGLTGGVFFPGLFRASFQSKVRTASYAAQIVLDEMKKMREFGASSGEKAANGEDEELLTAKRSFIDTLPRRFSTKTQVVNILLDEEFTGRYKTDPDYYARYQANVDRVSKADVKRAAGRLLHPESVTLLVVGKKSDLLNPDPKHPVTFAELTGGRFTEMPLRDPMTLKPMAPVQATTAGPK